MNVPLLLPRSTAKKSSPTCSIATCWRDTAASDSTISLDVPRPMTRRSPSNVAFSPTFCPSMISSRIAAMDVVSVVEDRDDVNRGERPHPRRERDVRREPHLQQVVVPQLRIERDLDLLLAEDEPHGLPEIFLLR